MRIVDPFWWIDDGQTVTPASELLDWWHVYYSIEPWDTHTRLMSDEEQSGKVSPDAARNQLDMLFGR